jgi:signal transduction histidine kinase/CheY-like chemotaxis protein
MPEVQNTHHSPSTTTTTTTTTTTIHYMMKQEEEQEKTFITYYSVSFARLIPLYITVMFFLSYHSKSPFYTLVTLGSEVAFSHVCLQLSRNYDNNVVWKIVRRVIMCVLKVLHYVVSGPLCPMYLWIVISVVPLSYFLYNNVYTLAAMVVINTIALWVGMFLAHAPIQQILQVTFIVASLLVATHAMAHTLMLHEKEKLELLQTKLTTESEQQKQIIATTSKSEAIVSLSNEISTAISGITSGVELFLRDSSCRMQIQKDIRANAQLLTNLVHTTLDHTLIATGRIQMKHERYSIRTTLENCITAMSQSAFDKGLEVYSFINTNVPEEILGDEIRVTQVVLNLLSNAVTFSETGYVYLSCYCEDNQLIIECKDTGIGISKATQATGELFRGSPDYVKRQGSLGLPLCNNLMKMMKGKLTVDSALGKGSIFSIILPLDVPEDSEIPEPSKSSKYRTAVLTADPILSDIMKKYLQFLGVGHIEVLPSVDSLQLSTRGPGIIFVDDDNQECIQVLAQHYEGSLVKLVRITRQILEPDTRIEVIRKPIKLSQLEELIQHPFSPHHDDMDDGTDHNNYSDFSVLIVEDSVINRRIIQNILSKMSISNITLASNGKAAYDLYVQHIEHGKYFNLITTGITMQQMDGHELCESIRKYEEENNIQPTTIVALSQTSTKEEFRRIVRTGFDHMFPIAPVNPQLLMDYIQLLAYKTPFAVNRKMVSQ